MLKSRDLFGQHSHKQKADALYYSKIDILVFYYVRYDLQNIFTGMCYKISSKKSTSDWLLCVNCMKKLHEFCGKVRFG
jgi:hypothetical protein